MNELVRIEVAVDKATALAPAETHRLRALGRLLDRMVRRGADDPLAALLEVTASDATAAGLGEADIEAELGAYNAERRG